MNIEYYNYFVLHDSAQLLRGQLLLPAAPEASIVLSDRLREVREVVINA
jgi:hypothetical protein